MNARDEVIDWLRDAYAMERGLEVTLKKISESEAHPAECRSACAMHLEETRQHAQTVEWLLKSLGTDTSTVKTGVGMMTETMKGLGTAMSHDEVVKDLLASYSMEHFEIACYTALAAAAEVAGLSEVAEACDEIIADEENMAEMISQSLPRIVQQYLSGETGETMSKAA
jgi:ferritin-like metal-binding protein YciE